MINRGRELIAHQLAPDGTLPEELHRTRSLILLKHHLPEAEVVPWPNHGAPQHG